MDTEWSAHFQAARRAQLSGNLDEAVREYLRVTQLAPNLVEAQVNLGLVYYLQTRYSESAGALEKALSLQPDFRGANLFLGIDDVRLGLPHPAIPCLKLAVRQEPGNKEARTWLSRALWDAGQKAEAISELRDAARLFPSDPDVLFLLGQGFRNTANEQMAHVLAVVGTPLYHQAVGDIYREEHVWDLALRHYQRALEKDPHRTGTHLGLGEIYFQQGKWEAARSEFKAEGSAGAKAKLAEIALLEGQSAQGLRLLNEAIQSGPGAANALGLPRLPFVENARFDEEVKARYQQSLSAIKEAPSSPSRSLALAATYLRLGLNQESAREWENYRATAPSRFPTGDEHQRTMGEFERHNFDVVRARLTTFLAAHPNDLEAPYMLAQSCHWLSLSVLADMLAATPDSPRTHQLFALTLAEQEENDKALAEYRKVEILAPHESGLHFAVGELLWKMKRADDALAEFEQELRLSPGHAEASAAAGTILVSEHKPERAIPYLERAVQLKPELLLAHVELGKALYQLREFPKAAPELEKAAAADLDGSVHYFLAVVYRALGRSADAAAAFTESSRIKDERLTTIRSEKPKEVDP